MDFAAIYSFLFESFAGIGCLVGGVLVISLLVAFILEIRTRKQFVDREGDDDDDWSFFDDDEEEDK